MQNDPEPLAVEPAQGPAQGEARGLGEGIADAVRVTQTLALDNFDRASRG